MNIQLDEKACDQYNLPIKVGGLGINLASEVALPAYLSSVFSSRLDVNGLIPHPLKEDQNIFYK